MLRSLLKTFRYILGWPEIQIPSESFVSVVVHTSYFDAFIIGLYCMEVKVLLALNPRLYNMAPRVFKYLNFIPSKALEDRGSGGVDFLVNHIKKEATEKTIFFISPKGTIQKKEWRSGYKYIAKSLGWPIRTGLVDFSKRTFSFGPPHSADDDGLEETLQNELGDYCPSCPEKCEVCIKTNYDPYELLSIPDIVCLTNLFLVPSISKAFYSNEYILGILSSCSFITSWLYHSSKESEYASLDRSLASITFIWGLSRVKRISLQFIVNTFFAAVFYLLGVPRDASKQRGKYVVYHSLFHVFAGFASYSSMT